MPLDPLILMIFGVALIVVAAVWYRPSIGIRSGNVIAGDAHGTTAQTYISRDPSRPEKDDRIGVRDWVGWLIGLLGAAVSAYGIYLQFFAA